MYSTVIALIFSSLLIALTGLYVWLTYCAWVGRLKSYMEKRPKKGPR